MHRQAVSFLLVICHLQSPRALMMPFTITNKALNNVWRKITTICYVCGLKTDLSAAVRQFKCTLIVTKNKQIHQHLQYLCFCPVSIHISIEDHLYCTLSISTVGWLLRLVNGSPTGTGAPTGEKLILNLRCRDITRLGLGAQVPSPFSPPKDDAAPTKTENRTFSTEGNGNGR